MKVYDCLMMLDDDWFKIHYVTQVKLKISTQFILCHRNRLFISFYSWPKAAWMCLLAFQLYRNFQTLENIYLPSPNTWMMLGDWQFFLNFQKKKGFFSPLDFETPSFIFQKKALLFSPIRVYAKRKKRFRFRFWAKSYVLSLSLSFSLT